MNLPYLKSHLIVCIVLGFLVFSSCHNHGKNNSNKDAISTVSGDNVRDTKTILNKVNTMVTANKLEDATAYITADLPHFQGADKAVLLNARGDVYILKDDNEDALSNYIGATEIEPENATYLINVARTYELMESLSNATIFAKKVLDLTAATDTEKSVARDMILRCDRIHSGH